MLIQSFLYFGFEERISDLFVNRGKLIQPLKNKVFAERDFRAKKRQITKREIYNKDVINFFFMNIFRRSSTI